MSGEKIIKTFKANRADYHYATWAGSGTPLLLVHGITASHMAWPRLVRALEGNRPLYAPDLRGRGNNGKLPGPYGFAAHIEDLLRLFDHEKIDKAVWIGHSLGAYIGLDFAHEHPDRLHALILVDGGIALPLREGKTPEDVIKAVLGPALKRLDMRFKDRDSYHQFWREHPAFQDAGAWNSDVEAYIDYDLGGEPPAMHSVVNPEAIAVDSYGPMAASMVNRIDQVKVPILLLTAPRGLLNQTQPLLPPEAVKAKAQANPHLSVAEIDDTNHYSIVTGSGARPLANKIGAYLSALGL